MPLATSTITNALKDRTGIGCSGLSDDAIALVIKSGLAEYSKYRQRSASGSFHYQAGVTNYLFPNEPDFPANLVNITDVFYASQTAIDADFSFEDLFLESVQGDYVTLDFGGNIFENPSLVRIFFQKLREFRSNVGMGDWDIFPTSPKKTLRLLASPKNDGVGYWEGSLSWTQSDIPEADFEIFYKACLWKLAEVRAMSLAVAKSYKEGSNILVEPAFDFWNTKAKDFREQFLQDVGAFGGIISVG
jgi:hypothetical protein